MRILFIHGRAQGGKDPIALAKTWNDTLKKGLDAAGADLPDGVTVDFPYYGDTLDDFTARADLPSPDDVVSKGTGQDAGFEAFMQSALDEMYQKSALTEDQVEAEMTTGEVLEKGPQNWGWVQAIARALDRRFTATADWTIDRFLKDVYLYVNNPTVTRGINAIVEDLITDEPTVVVGHSLGTVVGYKIIQENQGRLHTCKYITLGSPLGIRAISSKLGLPENLAQEGWYNAYDEGDVVALNPLDDRYFPTDPEIVNNNGIHNITDNQHGIVGYLNDANVAAEIVKAVRSHE